jgi:hypothetical protein
MQDRICQVDETSCNARPDHTFGSKAALTAPKCDFSFTPETGLNSDIKACPKRATSRHGSLIGPRGHENLVTEPRICPREVSKELHATRLQVVHCAGHLDLALRFHFSKHGAVLPDISNGHLNILSRDSVDKGIVFRRTLARE